MAELPDELWRQILEIGLKNSTKFSYKDLCCISISCRRLHRLSNEDYVWSHLLSTDFPSQNPNPNNNSEKSTYKIRFERVRDKKVAAHRRAVLRKESEIFEHERKIKELQRRLIQETDKLKLTANELSNLHNVRQASVALNVWQPEVVRGRQKQIVEQCVVSVESRVHSLEMELKLCKQQIAVLNKAHRDEKQRLERSREELASMKYHPFQDFRVTSSQADEHNRKRKKLKTSTKLLTIYAGSDNQAETSKEDIIEELAD